MRFPCYSWPVVTNMTEFANVIPKTHPRFGRPTTTSVYRDEQGATLFRVLRFDPPGERKQFLTFVTMARRGGVALALERRSVAAPSLYNLDKLAARSDAFVVICEGEKSADAAARVFPNCVPTPRGSDAEIRFGGTVDRPEHRDGCG
jgi:hypothetical protein